MENDLASSPIVLQQRIKLEKQKGFINTGDF